MVIPVESLTHEALNQVVDKLNQHCPLSLLKHKIDDLVSDEIWTPKHILELFTSTRLRNDIELQEYANSIRRGDHWTRTSYFVIDPIDGTKGFLRGEQFAIGLCLVDCYSGEPQVGVIGCPNLPHVLQSKQRQFIMYY